MNLRGRILNLSLESGINAAPFVFICTEHDGDIITIVPAAPGAEGMAYYPRPVTTEIGGDGARLHGSTIDQDLVDIVKNRCTRLITLLSRDDHEANCGELHIYARATLHNAEINLERLESLDGNMPVEDDDPDPVCYECKALIEPLLESVDRIFSALGDTLILAELR